MKIKAGFIQRQARRGIPILIMAVGVLACYGNNLYAQDGKLNLSRLNGLASKAEQVANVDLEGPMLKLAAGNLNEKNPTPKQKAEQEMIEHLKGIYVRSYQFSKPGEYSHADVENVLEQLRSGGWTSVVNVEKKNEGEMTAVYVMNEGGEPVGMAVISAKPTKLTVVNLVGPVDFAQLDNLDDIFNATGFAAGIRSQPHPQRATH